MSNIMRVFCTAKATYWQSIGTDKWHRAAFAPPKIIMCDYGGDINTVKISIGQEIEIKNTIWTEFSETKKGDYILLGESSEPDPIAAGADEVMHVIRYADTFDRLNDDYAIITG